MSDKQRLRYDVLAAGYGLAAALVACGLWMAMMPFFAPVIARTESVSDFFLGTMIFFGGVAMAGCGLVVGSRFGEIGDELDRE